MSKKPSSPLRVREIQIRTHAHATESLPKVKECLNRLCPFEMEENSINFENLSGNYGNPIRALTLNFSLKEQTTKCIENFGKMLLTQDKTFLKEEFPIHLDDRHRFYFRLSKQALAMGKIELAQDNDVIRVVIAVQNKDPKNKLTPERVLEYLESLNFF